MASSMSSCTLDSGQLWPHTVQRKVTLRQLRLTRILPFPHTGQTKAVSTIHPFPVKVNKNLCIMP
ncbi:hypothetical protein LZ24_01299 [Desulfobotulus alkaliphilus]|uniref:Uncharacterized protein n=1 Tax=Desulfobotulus alkaliphilus TaxID=622671 RepID=A0A562RVW8_9BACT|nr:hypothetical protein LZ24_01299 [Desulfobotulus alkaliphilus]